MKAQEGILPKKYKIKGIKTELRFAAKHYILQIKRIKRAIKTLKRTLNESEFELVCGGLLSSYLNAGRIMQQLCNAQHSLTKIKKKEK